MSLDAACYAVFTRRILNAKGHSFYFQKLNGNNQNEARYKYASLKIIKLANKNAKWLENTFGVITNLFVYQFGNTILRQNSERKHKSNYIEQVTTLVIFKIN